MTRLAFATPTCHASDVEVSGYWRRDAVRGSAKLLAMIRSESDANMYPPKGWKPHRKPEPISEPEPIRQLPPPKEEWFHVVDETSLRPTVRQIQVATCRHFRIHLKDLLSHRRTKDITGPRHIAMYLAMQLTSFSLPNLGKMFGNKDHTCLCHSRKKVSARLLVDEDFAFDVAILFQKITGLQQ